MPTAASVPPEPADARAEVCVIADGRLTRVPVVIQVGTGDTLYHGRRFREAFPDTLPYAARQAWYVNAAAINVKGRRLLPFGLDRVIQPHELALLDSYRGVPVFVEAGALWPVEVVYALVRPGCEFRVYQDMSNYRRVRG